MKKKVSLPDQVASCLQAHVSKGQRLTVGLSGGVDSVVLIHVLSSLQSSLEFNLSAIHVNHQISPNASSWATFCSSLCESLGIECRTAAVHVDSAGHGVEASARKARYQVYENLNTDFVVLAHHLDDQAETMLLQLLRGSGVEGASAMPVVRDFKTSGGKVVSRILRPLLEITRAEIESYAREHRLQWVEDESNELVSYGRNYLRHKVLPVIGQRFPAYRDTLYRASRHFAEAAELQEELARIDMAASVENRTLNVTVLKGLSPARAKNLLRGYLASCGAKAPDSIHLEEMLHQLCNAATDANIEIKWNGFVVRRYREKVFIEASQSNEFVSFCLPWRGEHQLLIPQLGGVLNFIFSKGQGISAKKLAESEVTVRARQGGETMRHGYAAKHRTLKNLFQEAGVPPWVRNYLPLLFAGEELVWVPEIGIAADYQAAEGEQGLQISWECNNPANPDPE